MTDKVATYRYYVDPCWGLASPVDKHEHEAALERIRAYIAERLVSLDFDHVAVEVCAGDSPIRLASGTRLTPAGEDDLTEVCQAAWEHAIDTWPPPKSPARAT